MHILHINFGGYCSVIAPSINKFSTLWNATENVEVCRGKLRLATENLGPYSPGLILLLPLTMFISFILGNLISLRISLFYFWWLYLHLWLHDVFIAIIKNFWFNANIKIHVICIKLLMVFLFLCCCIRYWVETLLQTGLSVNQWEVSFSQLLALTCY